MVEQGSTPIEFNSMVAILKRLDQTTYDINNARATRNLPVMVDRLVDYYKDISSDLEESEKSVWNDLVILKRFVNPMIKEKFNWILNKADELDIKLRALAKKHGYLTKNMKDVRTAITNM